MALKIPSNSDSMYPITLYEIRTRNTFIIAGEDREWMFS